MENKIENYLVLAQNALDGNNYVDCDNYVNKVLENDSVNTDAYLLKIKALLIKQRYGYNEDEQKIEKYQFMANVEKQKSSCYSILINKCAFSEKHIQPVMDFVMDDFFNESSEYVFDNIRAFESDYQKLNNKVVSTDLLVHVLRNVNNSSDDKIIEAFLGIYQKAKEDGKGEAESFLMSCFINQKYEFKDKDIAEKFYRELIKIYIYQISYDYGTFEHTIKEIMNDINCLNDKKLDDCEISDVKNGLYIIERLVENIKKFNPSYDLRDDELNEKVKLLNFWISAHYKKYATSTYNTIKRINSDYIFDENIENAIKSYANENKQGCYVATCVYGSYDCPEVWTLRRFRDKTLYKSFMGKCFIKIYYFVSPKVVRLLGETDWFRNFCKKKLDKFVSKLQNQGYKNTKYFD